MRSRDDDGSFPRSSLFQAAPHDLFFAPLRYAARSLGDPWVLRGLITHGYGCFCAMRQRNQTATLVVAVGISFKLRGQGSRIKMTLVSDGRSQVEHATRVLLPATR